MRRTLLALAALSLIAGCAVIVVPDSGDGSVQYKSSFSGSAVQGDGNNVVENRQVANLDGIDINGPLVVEVRVGPAASLQVEGDSNILPMLRTDASAGTLRIWVEGNIRTSNPLRVVYTTPALRHVAANGSGQLSISGLNGGPLDLSLNGSRSVRLNGTVDRLDARLNGSGGLNVSGLTSESADLSSNGSGSISAAVTQALVADANGSGRVTVYGNPSQRTVSGKRVTVVQ